MGRQPQRSRNRLGRYLASLAAALLAAGLPAEPTAAAPRAAAAGVAPAGSSAHCTPDGLACTPYMGWNTYYGLGSQFSESTIVSVANAMVSRGLRTAGYDYVWIDGGWWNGTRDASGNITVSKTQWPHGMKWLTDYIHSLGLKAGIYTDAGINGCGGPGQGSYGHYQQDASQFAAWGFDAVKVDFCGGTEMGLDPATAYRQFRDALLNNSSHRPMLLNICNPFVPGELGPGDPPYDRSAYYSYTFGPATGNSWRTDTDIGFVHSIQWPDVLRNLDADAAHPGAAGPGHWNDPDYLGPELGMTPAEAQAQFTMWAMVAAPLIIGSDVRSLSSQAIAMLTNRAVIAIDQDPLGVQGTRIAREGDGDVWVKPLADGDRAVALLNRGSVPLTLSTTAAAVGLPHADRYTMANLWTHTATETAGAIRATVAPDSAVLYRVSAGAAPGTPPAVTLSAPHVQAPASAAAGPVLPPGQDAHVGITLFNDGREPVTGTRLSLTAPGQIQVSPQAPQRTAAVPPGRHLTVTWLARAAPGALPGGVFLDVTAGWRWGGNRTAAAHAAAALTVPYPPPTGTAYLSGQPWLDAASGWEYVTRDASVANAGPITMQGHEYQKGLGVASVSQADFFLGGQCQRLLATVGIDDIVNQVSSQGGTAEFEIYGDGTKIYDSGIVNRTSTRNVDVNIAGIKVLTLYVGDGGDGTYNDRADWAGLQVSCDPGLATVPSGPWPHLIPQQGLTATATSFHPGYPPQYAVDGKLTTFWHSEWQPPAPLPQSITIDLGSPHEVTGLIYSARQDGGTSGIITGYTVSVSTDGTSFTQVARGSWPSGTSTRSAAFPPAQARYVRLTAASGIAGYASAAEINITDIPSG
ncbi:MAG TPA: NPCBM/NEW2 domain-containing protein [Streptosporangiaceae bacterium]|nr:NPCBM/NEW2 domain-containing protein [Streptosporangiaceae bacterium]